MGRPYTKLAILLVAVAAPSASALNLKSLLKSFVVGDDSPVLAPEAAADEESPPQGETGPEAKKKESPTCENKDGKEEVYGVDVSYPSQSHSVSKNYAWLPHNIDPKVPTPEEFKDSPIQPLGDKQTFYEKFMQGCRDALPEENKKECDISEGDRIAMNIRQPQSMNNYTDFGIKKIRAPKAVMDLLTEFWEKNKGSEYEEDWSVGNSYVNYWDNPSYMLSIENSELKGGGKALNQKVWDAASETVSEWTGRKLATSSVYGIRLYKEGAVLAPHVDRLPLVSSAIINVAQDVDEPWPIEVYTHDGRAHNITMEPGDMVLYESHSVIHGRPFPLKGRFFANIFIHFQPEAEDPDALPDYLVPDSPGAVLWAREHKSSKRSTEAHAAAGTGNLELLKEIAASDERRADLFAPDENHWQPLHEAARAGQVDAVRFLLDQPGADVNARAWYGMGSTALWIAVDAHGEDAPVAKLLRSRGGENIAPRKDLYD